MKKHNEKQYLLIRKRVAKRAILPIVAIMGLSVLGGQWLYFEAKDKITDVFKPEVKQAEAQNNEPSNMIDWIMWRVEKEGINKFEAYAIISKESQRDDQNTGINCGKSPSVDMGIWQLNTTKWHSKKTKHYISPTCAYDYKCATEEAIKIYHDWGNTWGAWTTAKDLGLVK